MLVEGEMQNDLKTHTYAAETKKNINRYNFIFRFENVFLVY